MQIYNVSLRSQSLPASTIVDRDTLRLWETKIADVAPTDHALVVDMRSDPQVYPKVDSRYVLAKVGANGQLDSQSIARAAQELPGIVPKTPGGSIGADKLSDLGFRLLKMPGNWFTTDAQPLQVEPLDTTLGGGTFHPFHLDSMATIFQPHDGPFGSGPNEEKMAATIARPSYLSEIIFTAMLTGR